MNIKHRFQGTMLELSWQGRDWFRILDPPSTLSNEEEVQICLWVAKQWSRMPSGVEAEVDLPPVLRQPESEIINFFPGSFNPWHDGHSACLALSRLRPIIVVPDANPWKESNRAKEWSPWQAIIELIKKLPKESEVAVYPGFWGAHKLNPTVEWLPLSRWDKRCLTLGADSFLSLHKWKDADQLLKFIDILYVVPRELELATLQGQIERVKEFNEAICIEILNGHNYEHLASSTIRNKSK